MHVNHSYLLGSAKIVHDEDPVCPVLFACVTVVVGFACRRLTVPGRPQKALVIDKLQTRGKSGIKK